MKLWWFERVQKNLLWWEFRTTEERCYATEKDTDVFPTACSPRNTSLYCAQGLWPLPQIESWQMLITRSLSLSFSHVHLMFMWCSCDARPCSDQWPSPYLDLPWRPSLSADFTSEQKASFINGWAVTLSIVFAWVWVCGFAHQCTLHACDVYT